MNSPNEDNLQKSMTAKYAQLSSSVINQYDASLIFFQVKPVQLDKENIQKFKPSTEEVARITLPHRALKELSRLLVQQIKELEAKTGEDKTISKLKNEKKAK